MREKTKRDWKLYRNFSFTYHYDHQATDGSKTDSLNIRGSKVGNYEGYHSTRVISLEEICYRCKYVVLRSLCTCKKIGGTCAGCEITKKVDKKT